MRKEDKMNKITLNTIKRQYTNNGQHAEQVFRFTLTGEIRKADNLSHTEGGDVLDIQIKSARATVCRGTDLKAYLDLDGANRYAYVTSDFENAYIMSREEYTEFVNEFGTVTRESQRNGGHAKIRLAHEGARMKAWLEERA